MVKQESNSQKAKTFGTGVGHISNPSAQVVRRGLEFISASWNGSGWGTQSARTANAWLTAYVLSRLGELPRALLNGRINQHVEASLDWLISVEAADSGWSRNATGSADLVTTTQAVIALRSFGRKPPAAASDFIGDCQQPDGSYAEPDPHARAERVPLLTALAVNATGTILPRTADYLSAQINPGDAAHRGVLSRLILCSEVLEGEVPAAVPAIAQPIAEFVRGMKSADLLKQSLLLRCLIRLRLKPAWQFAAAVRSAQLDNGAWAASKSAERILAGPVDLAPGPEEKAVFMTATAVAALAMGQTQPGLYFGSDQPAPRRLYEF